MYFLVNVSPSKPLDLATSNFVAAKVTYDVGGTGLHIMNFS